MLFEDKREVELVWNGKTREVCTTILLFSVCSTQELRIFQVFFTNPPFLSRVPQEAILCARTRNASEEPWDSVIVGHLQQLVVIDQATAPFGDHPLSGPSPSMLRFVPFKVNHQVLDLEIVDGPLLQDAECKQITNESEVDQHIKY